MIVYFTLAFDSVIKKMINQYIKIKRSRLDQFFTLFCFENGNEIFHTSK